MTCQESCIESAKAGCIVTVVARRMDMLKSMCEEINNFVDAGDCEVLLKNLGNVLDVLMLWSIMLELETWRPACSPQNQSMKVTPTRYVIKSHMPFLILSSNKIQRAKLLVKHVQRLTWSWSLVKFIKGKSRL